MTSMTSLLHASKMFDLSESEMAPKQDETEKTAHGFLVRSNSWSATLTDVAKNSSRSNASALDALAALAVTFSSSSNNHGCSSSDEDSESMPPPPPRRIGRMRSASNPEGFEKWDSYHNQTSRRHFVLPSSILEEELASANIACKAYNERMSCYGTTKFDFNQSIDDDTLESGSPTTVFLSATNHTKKHFKSPMKLRNTATTTSDELDEEANLEPEELLRRARSKLLEDLTNEMGLHKGSVLPLPHSVEKYKEIYNKNGRIGIYTPSERAAIISKFNSKRSRRVWNKKIRYNCRKNLADRRMRVKGRFVKRSVEFDPSTKLSDESSEVKNTTESSSSGSSRTSSPVPSTPPNGPLPPVYEDDDDASEDNESVDTDMPDVNDPEAGFKPTASQPYRRIRRHTIT